MTGEEMIWELWRKCLLAAREEGDVPAETVQKLISQTREILTEQGCTKHDADMVFYGIYENIHWDWQRPTDRIFETLLDFELTEFFKEQGLES
jgi:hypothetical protein